MQELSLEWTGKLHCFFASRNYYLITTQYGNKFNGYMGVGIAYPMSKFILQEGDITRIADTKRVIKEVKQQGTISQLRRKLSGSNHTILCVDGNNIIYSKAFQKLSLKEYELCFLLNSLSKLIFGTVFFIDPTKC